MINSKIPLMDLKRQYESIEDSINEKILKVLKSGSYIMGEVVEKFEKNFADYIGCKYAIGVGNGTDALVIALKALGLEKGDEVIVSAMSFFASAEAIALLGAVPVFVDCNRDTYTLDTSKIEDKITEKTKVIMPVQLYGQCCNMDEIRKIAKKYNIYVIEDAAQASGSEYKGIKSGNLADISCFSFFPTKNLGCAGDGGIITTNNKDLAKKCRALRVHGSGLDGEYMYKNVNKDSNKVINFADNPPKYYNFVIGYNSRLDAIQAAILDVKLPYLDEWNEKRRNIAEKYNKEITNKLIKKPNVGNYNKHIYYVYVISSEKRSYLKKYLNDNGITTGIYFPVALHLQKVFEKLGYKKGDMPNAEFVAEHTLAIPMFPELREEEQSYIIKTINDFK